MRSSAAIFPSPPAGPWQITDDQLVTDELSDVRCTARLIIQSHGSMKVNENGVALPSPPTVSAFGMKGQFSEESSAPKRRLLCSRTILLSQRMKRPNSAHSMLLKPSNEPVKDCVATVVLPGFGWCWRTPALNHKCSFDSLVIPAKNFHHLAVDRKVG
jgi:hypothetical protein